MHTKSRSVNDLVALPDVNDVVALINYEVVYSLKRSAYYYAFYKGTDDKVLAALQEALDGLAAGGELAEIVEKHTHH